MSDRKREPTPADGPLFKAAYERAGEVDEAQGPQKRRKWAGFIGAAAAALAEGLLRETMIIVAVGSSLLAAVFGVTSGKVLWAVLMAALGLAGAVLVFYTQYKKWSFGRQWAVLIGVTIVQAGLMVALWQVN